MVEEAVLILPGDDECYYTYNEVDMQAAGVATVVTRQVAEEAGYSRPERKSTPR